MVDYALSTKGCQIWLPETNKVVETINVTFNEEATDFEQCKGVELGPTYILNQPESNIDFYQNKLD